MSATAREYQDQLFALIPPGEALTRDPDSTIGKILLALADELARIDLRYEDLVDREFDVSIAAELLAEWEKMVGLPDGCGSPPGSEIERRRLVIQRLTDRGLMTPAGLVEEAAKIGYEIEVREFEPTLCGDECGSELSPAPIWFYFEVVYAGTTEIEPELGLVVCGDPLGDSIGPARLVCLIDRMKPAHTLYAIVPS